VEKSLDPETEPAKEVNDAKPIRPNRWPMKIAGVLCIISFSGFTYLALELRSTFPARFFRVARGLEQDGVLKLLGEPDDRNLNTLLGIEMGETWHYSRPTGREGDEERYEIVFDTGGKVIVRRKLEDRWNER
jgi:hypothetical protein